jgi:hypothetical protein
MVASQSGTYCTQVHNSCKNNLHVHEAFVSSVLVLEEFWGKSKTCATLIPKQKGELITCLICTNLECLEYMVKMSSLEQGYVTLQCGAI